MNPEVPAIAPFRESDKLSEDSATLATTLAADVGQHLQRAIDVRGYASLVVSGGSTPKPFLQALSGVELPWQKVTVTLADERWVAIEHPDSNESFVHQHLLHGPASAAKFVSLKSDARTPEAGWAEIEQRIGSIVRPFDVVILGMGGDGHTASLFPDTEGLQEALTIGCSKLTWPMNPPTVPQARMSLTLDALLQSDLLVLHITGAEKKHVFEQALSTSPTVFPVAAVIQASDKLAVYWAP